MFDVFNEEIEVLIKKGISNLYWYRGDLEKVWLRAGVKPGIVSRLFAKRTDDNQKLTKRELMDELYREIREDSYNSRLEISRNFVRYLTEHNNFLPANEKHRVELAESAALKLREIIAKQAKERESKSVSTKKSPHSVADYYASLAELNTEFVAVNSLEGQERGYAFERFITALMKLSGVVVYEPFRIVGEQIDGAIKYGDHYYLLELKWTKKKAAQMEVSSLFVKVEGKLEARGIFIAMNGFSDEIVEALPKGKRLNMLFMDGRHIANVVSGSYKFTELLEHGIAVASLKGDIYCPHTID